MLVDMPALLQQVELLSSLLTAFPRVAPVCRGEVWRAWFPHPQVVPPWQGRQTRGVSQHRRQWLLGALHGHLLQGALHGPCLTRCHFMCLLPCAATTAAAAWATSSSSSTTRQASGEERWTASGAWKACTCAWHPRQRRWPPRTQPSAGADGVRLRPCRLLLMPASPAWTPLSPWLPSSTAPLLMPVPQS